MKDSMKQEWDFFEKNILCTVLENPSKEQMEVLHMSFVTGALAMQSLLNRISQTCSEEQAMQQMQQIHENILEECYAHAERMKREELRQLH